MADVITITINGNASGLVGAATQAEGALGRLEGTAAKAGGVLSSVFSGIGQGVGFAAGLAGINGIAGALKTMGDSAIGLNSKLEQAQIGFTSMLGSGEKAQAFLQELQQFAATTPFEFNDLVTASQRMLAFGFEAKQVRPLLTAVGSAAAAMGSGKSGIDQITRALGQMRAATVVQAGELNQLTEAGVPAFQLLADKMGISTGEVKKLVEQGKIASDVFIDAFQEWANANFGDMMAKQALTFQGAMSTITDTLQMTGARAFRPLFELMSQGVVAFSQFVQTDTFTAWADAVAAGIENVVRQLGDAVRTVRQVFADDWLPSDQIEPFTLAIGVAAQAVKQFADIVGPYLSRLAGIVSQALNRDIAGAFESFKALASDVVTQLGPILAEWGRAFIEWVAPMIPPFLAAVADIGAQLITWIGEQVPPIVAQLAVWGEQFVAWVAPMIPPFLAAVGEIGLQLLTWIGAQIPPIIAQLTLWGAEFVAWVAPQIPPLVAALTALGAAMLAWVAAQIPPLVQSLLAWGGEFVAWVAPQIGPMLSELGKLILAGLDWIIAQVPGITAKLVEWGILFGAWVVTTAVPELIKNLPMIYKTIVDWIATAALEIGARVVDLGIAIAQGIYDGFVNAWATIGPRIMQSIQGSLSLPSWLGGSAPASRGGAGTGDYDAQAIAAAQKYGLQDPTGFAAQLRQESGNYAPDVVSGQRKSSAGATGIAQFMPGTAARYNVDPTDPSASIDAAARYMADLIKETGSQQEAAARYYGAPSANSADGRYYLNAIETQRRNVRMPTPNVPQVSQFALGLAPDEALAACGPAALAWFMNQTGRTPSGQEVKQLAAAAGWDPSRGMYGPAAFGRALSSVGISNVVDTSPTSAEVGSLAAAGTPFGISTGGYTDEFGQSRPGHYFQVQGGSLEGLNVGLSGTALKGGSSIMSLAQIQAMTGPMNALITLSGQMGDAITDAGAQGGQALDGLLTSVTTLADGSQISITQMGETITATVTDASGQIIASYGTMTATVGEQTTALATAVPEQFATMGAATLQSVTDLGAGILTTMTDSAGSTIATVTDMSGQVTSQYATLANGVSLTMGDMAAGVMTTVTDMGNGMVTTITDANGNMVSTVTDAAGNVTSQYTSMASEAGSAVEQFASDSGAAFNSIEEPANNAVASMEKVNDVELEAPEVGGIVDAFGEIEEAAEDAKEAAEDAKQAFKSLDQVKGGNGKKTGFEKRASGGWTQGLTLVGEEGPEFISPTQPTYVTDAGRTAAMRSGGISEEALTAAFSKALSAMPRRGDINVYGAGTEEVVQEIRQILDEDQRTKSTLYGVRRTR